MKDVGSMPERRSDTQSSAASTSVFPDIQTWIYNSLATLCKGILDIPVDRATAGPINLKVGHPLAEVKGSMPIGCLTNMAIASRHLHFWRFSCQAWTPLLKRTFQTWCCQTWATVLAWLKEYVIFFSKSKAQTLSLGSISRASLTWIILKTRTSRDFYKFVTDGWTWQFKWWGSAVCTNCAKRHPTTLKTKSKMQPDKLSLA